MLARVTNNNAAALTRRCLQNGNHRTAKACGIAAVSWNRFPGRPGCVELSGAHIRPLFPDAFFKPCFFAQSADVRDTIIDGNIVMRNRKLLH